MTRRRFVKRTCPRCNVEQECVVLSKERVRGKNSVVYLLVRCLYKAHKFHTIPRREDYQ